MPSLVSYRHLSRANPSGGEDRLRIHVDTLHEKLKENSEKHIFPHQDFYCLLVAYADEDLSKHSDVSLVKTQRVKTAALALRPTGNKIDGIAEFTRIGLVFVAKEAVFSQAVKTVTSLLRNSTSSLHGRSYQVPRHSSLYRELYGGIGYRPLDCVPVSHAFAGVAFVLDIRLRLVVLPVTVRRSGLEGHEGGVPARVIGFHLGNGHLDGAGDADGGAVGVGEVDGEVPGHVNGGGVSDLSPASVLLEEIQRAGARYHSATERRKPDSLFDRATTVLDQPLNLLFRVRINKKYRYNI
ncbi:hypothetical protein B0T21DRAFT_353781 [Apiosordaria backusii]|uniref:Uncharacterized protein n=1 Tax=Apiosordaria backusii TaxID=314023 RepID=A0AA40DFJ5_9PEZI|nr:hypothetical protein B0T21DRAFT_353781 [Apiosordaria backusii]